MTEEQVSRYEEAVLNAKNAEDIKRISQEWNPVLIKCFRSQALRTKELNKKMDDLQKQFIASTIEISTRITELHKKPTIRDSKIEWALANVERILLTIIVLALIFGRKWVADFLN